MDLSEQPRFPEDGKLDTSSLIRDSAACLEYLRKPGKHRGIPYRQCGLSCSPPVCSRRFVSVPGTPSLGGDWLAASNRRNRHEKISDCGSAAVDDLGRRIRTSRNASRRYQCAEPTPRCIVERHVEIAGCRHAGCHYRQRHDDRHRHRQACEET